MVKQRGEGYSWVEKLLAGTSYAKRTHVGTPATSTPTDTSRVDTIWLVPRVFGLIISSWYNIDVIESYADNLAIV